MSQQLELLTENPQQWTTVSLLTPEIQKKEIKPFVILALKELEGTPDSRTASLMNSDKFAAVREVVRHFTRLRSATKRPWAQDDAQIFLEGLRFSSECISELVTLLCTEKLYENIPAHLKVKPGLVSMEWKIDISLSQSSMSTDKSTLTKELIHKNTFVILILRLTNDQTQILRLDINTFQELRYIIASALKSLIILEKRKSMRNE